MGKGASLIRKHQMKKTRVILLNSEINCIFASNYIIVENDCLKYNKIF